MHKDGNSTRLPDEKNTIERQIEVAAYSDGAHCYAGYHAELEQDQNR
jgi:hypothetical protein